jgi:hypothetical protein
MADAAEEIEKYEAETGSWARTAKDLFAGAAGGVAQVLLGKSRKLCPSKDCWLWVSSIIASAFMMNVEDWVSGVGCRVSTYILSFNGGWKRNAVSEFRA